MMNYQVTRRARLLAGAAFGAIGILMGAGAASAQESPQDDAEAQEMTFTENFAREDLTPLEEGEAVRGLCQLYLGGVGAVADKLGKTKHWVETRAHLGNLSPAWRKAVRDEKLPFARWGRLPAPFCLAPQRPCTASIYQSLCFG
jgi:hypothetical protein